MRQLILVMLLLPSIFLIDAQEKAIEHDYKGNIILSWSPLSAMDAYSRIRLGAEVGLSQRVSLSTDIGFNQSKYQRGSYYQSDRSYQVFEIRPELKFYLNDKYRARWYNSVELFYIDVKENLKDDYYFQDRGEIKVSYDAATYTRLKFGAHYKFGINLRMGSRMVFDPFVGIGIRFVEREYIDVEGAISDPDGGNMWDAWVWSDARRYEGNYWGLNFSAGFRLGIYLSK